MRALHFESESRNKFDAAQVPHFPVDVAHAKHPVAYALDTQQRLPTRQQLAAGVARRAEARRARSASPGAEQGPR